MRPSHAGLIPLLAALALGAGATGAPAAVRWVDDPGESPGANDACVDKPHIPLQQAIDAARPGDVVLACSGTWRERVTIGPGKDRVQLRAPYGATITTDGTTGDGDLVHVQGAHGVLVSGFTFTGRSDGVDRGTVVRVDHGATATVRDVALGGFSADDFPPYEAGVVVTDGRVNVVRARMAGVAPGVLADGPAAFAQVASSRFAQFLEEDGDPLSAVRIQGGGRGTIVANAFDAAAFTDQPGGVAIWLVDGDGRRGPTVVRHNRVEAGAIGAWGWSGYGDAAGAMARRDTIASNRLFGPGDVGVWIGDGTRGLAVRANTVRGRAIGIEAVGTDPARRPRDNVIAGNDVRASTEHDCLEWVFGATPQPPVLNRWVGNRGPFASEPAGICR